jgi:hypothetical protein
MGGRTIVAPTIPGLDVIAQELVDAVAEKGQTPSGEGDEHEECDDSPGCH